MKKKSMIDDEWIAGVIFLLVIIVLAIMV